MSASVDTPVSPYNSTTDKTISRDGGDVILCGPCDRSEAMPAEALEVEEGDDVEDADQEVEPLRTAPDPQLPTEAEVEDHRVDHTPYRIWCEWCRRSRGLGEQRGRGAGRSRASDPSGCHGLLLFDKR